MKKTFNPIIILLVCMASFFTNCRQEKVSTIDPVLQDTLTAILERKINEINAFSGQAIVMEVQTGEIKAMVGEGKPQESSGLMRTVSMLAALETGKVKLSDTVDTGGGVIVIHDRVMKDHNWHRGGYGEITRLKGMMVSSNIANYLTTKEAFEDAQAYIDMLHRMNYEAEQMVTPQDTAWNNTAWAWLTIGYNQLVYPFQMLTFYNAIANEGKMVRPMLYKGETKVINPQIASRENIDSIQLALMMVVKEGLGKPAGSDKVQVAGATGTSQLRMFENETNDKTFHEYSVEFCGYFPADEPKYSIIVSINKIGLPASGGTMAGSVFSEIVDYMVEKENIK